MVHETEVLTQNAFFHRCTFPLFFNVKTLDGSSNGRTSGCSNGRQCST